MYGNTDSTPSISGPDLRDLPVGKYEFSYSRLLSEINEFRGTVVVRYNNAVYCVKKRTAAGGDQDLALKLQRKHQLHYPLL
jgi:hypothetical protein